MVGTLRKRIYNVTPFDLYAIDITGKTYCVPKPFLGITNSLTNFIRFEIEDEDGEIEQTTYPSPEHGKPTMIKPMGTLLFINKAEMESEVKKFGSTMNLIHTYLTEETNLFFGAGKSIVNMSRNDYWITEGNRIFKVPKCDETWRNLYMHGGNLTEQDFGDKDLIVIYTYIGGNTKEGKLKTTNYTNRWVNRFNRNIMDPIILEDSNLFVFNSKEAAEFFITKYDGKLSTYFANVAASVTEAQHKEILQETNKEYKKDKLAIAKVAALIGGSAVLGAVVKIGLEKLIESIPKKGIELGIAYIGKTTLVASSSMAAAGLSTLSTFGIGAIIIAGLFIIDKVTSKFSDRDGVFGYVCNKIQSVKRSLSSFFTDIKSKIFDTVYGWVC